MNLPLFLMGFLLFLTSLFLIMIVLVQRGRGGGLTGALGGMGGQSAFGAKAGDTFTRITIFTAIFWIALCMVTIKVFNPPPPPEEARTGVSAGGAAPTVPLVPIDEPGDEATLDGIAPPAGPDPDLLDLDGDAGDVPTEIPGGGDFDGKQAPADDGAGENSTGTEDGDDGSSPPTTDDENGADDKDE